MTIRAQDLNKEKEFTVRFLITFAIGITAVILVSFIYIYQEFTLHQKGLQKDESLRLELASKFVTRTLQEVVTDLRWLSGSVAMARYLSDPDSKNTSDVEKEFLNLVRNTGRYDQIRIISVSGHEKIRVNYNKGSQHIVAKQNLQDKSSRYYFNKIMALDRGQIYISPLDLNIESGKVELPHKPVIRFGILLFKPGDSRPVGMLIFNYLVEIMFSDFEHMVSNGWGTSMILNQQGSWLYTQDNEKEPGFIDGNQETFGINYPAAWHSIASSKSGAFRNSRGLFIYTSLPEFSRQGVDSLESGKTAGWKIVSHISPEKLQFSLWEPVSNQMQTSLLVLLVTAALSFFFARLRFSNIQYTRALISKDSQHRNLFENMADGYALQEAIFDDKGKPVDFRYLEVNSAFEIILGMKREDVIGKTIRELLPDVEPYWIEVYGSVALSGSPARLEQYGGSFGRYFEIAASSPGYGLVAVIFADVTERKRNEEQLRQAAVVFNNTNEAVMVTDADAKVISINRAFTKVTGFELEDVVGKTPSFQKSGKHDDSFYQNLWRSLKETGQWQGEIWNRRKDGVLYPVWENVSVVKDEQGKTTNYISVFSDISTIKRTQNKLNHLAHHDSLTGLANRLAFTANLEQALERAQRHQNKVALLFMDLDRFKDINDNLGHAAGDRVLQVVAKRLKKSVRAQDVVCRLGGDEFTIILEELSRISDTEKLAKKIIDLVSSPITLENKEVAISTSIGISIYPDDADNAQDLAKAGDTAMYSAKSRGRHTFAYFSAELDTG